MRLDHLLSKEYPDLDEDQINDRYRSCSVLKEQVSFINIKHPFGGDGGGDPRVPISNTTVKPSSADGTWTAGSWESRTLPSKLQQKQHSWLTPWVLLFLCIARGSPDDCYEAVWLVFEGATKTSVAFSYIFHDLDRFDVTIYVMWRHTIGVTHNCLSYLLDMKIGLLLT